MIDHQAIAEEVERRFGTFLRERVNPTARERDQNYETFSPDLLREMAELGLIGFTASPEIGGGGRTWEEWGHALEEIGYLCDDSGLPMLLSYRETATNLVHRSGLLRRPHLIERYARPAVRGEAFIGWLLTEEKDLLSLDTTAVRRNGAYVLNGAKKASTGGASCTCWLVYAATEDRSDVMVFMVERDDPGVEVRPLPSLGLRSLGLCQVAFHDVELCKDRVAAPVDGLSHSQLFVNERRVTGSAWLLGRMRSLIERVIEDTLPKERFSRRLVDFDTFHAAIGRMQIALEAARSVAYRSFARTEAGRAEDGYLHDALVAVGKYLSTENALFVADTAQKLTGDHGYFERFEFDRYLRDFYGLVPIVGGQYAIETQLGERVISEHLRRRSPGAAAPITGGDHGRAR